MKEREGDPQEEERREWKLVEEAVTQLLRKGWGNVDQGRKRKANHSQGFDDVKKKGRLEFKRKKKKKISRRSGGRQG